MIIKAQTTLLLEQGAYSDTTWSGPFRVLKDIDQKGAEAMFRKQWEPKDKWETAPSPNEFIAWLAKEGFIEDIEPSVSWYLGGYGLSPDNGPAT